MWLIIHSEGRTIRMKQGGDRNRLRLFGFGGGSLAVIVSQKTGSENFVKTVVDISLY